MGEKLRNSLKHGSNDARPGVEGSVITLVLVDTWGDSNYIGLTGVQVRRVCYASVMKLGGVLTCDAFLMCDGVVGRCVVVCTNSIFTCRKSALLSVTVRQLSLAVT